MFDLNSWFRLRYAVRYLTDPIIISYQTGSFRTMFRVEYCRSLLTRLQGARVPSTDAEQDTKSLA